MAIADDVEIGANTCIDRGALDDTVIVNVLTSRPISDAVPELVEQALRQAGPKSDNVTALAVEWESAEDVAAVNQLLAK